MMRIALFALLALVAAATPVARQMEAVTLDMPAASPMAMPMDMPAVSPMPMPMDSAPADGGMDAGMEGGMEGDMGPSPAPDMMDMGGPSPMPMMPMDVPVTPAPMMMPGDMDKPMDEMKKPMDDMMGDESMMKPTSCFRQSVDYGTKTAQMCCMRKYPCSSKMCPGYGECRRMGAKYCRAISCKKISIM